MNNLKGMQHLQPDEQLLWYLPNGWNTKPRWILPIRNIEIVSEEICLDEELFSMVKHRFELEEMVFGRVTVGFDKFEQFDLVQGLIKEILIIADHFEACVFLREEILDF